MLNIADFGGFSGIAKMIQQVKDTGAKLNDLAESTGVNEIVEIKTKYIDRLDKFRPGNTEGVSSVAGDFNADADRVLGAIRSKITDASKLKQAEQKFGECRETIDYLLGVIMNALKKAS